MGRKIRLTHNHQVSFCSRTVNFREVRQVATGDIENRLADIDLLSIDNLFRKNNIQGVSKKTQPRNFPRNPLLGLWEFKIASNRIPRA